MVSVARAGERVRHPAPIVVLVFTAAYFAFVLLRLHAARNLGVPSNDYYGMFYPSISYARDSLARGGGLLWNPYQACGEPFLADATVGLFYPVNLVFFVLDRETAAQVSVLLNLMVAGVGALLLGRSIGLGRSAALCAALAFQLGGLTGHLASWSPIHIGTYAWMPVALWATERLVQRPTAPRAVTLGVVLTLQLFPGYLPIVFFTYQLVGLRLLWALITRESRRPLVLLGAVGAGLLMPAFLGAVQLLPSIELAAASVRTRPLPAWQIGQGANVFRGIGSLPDGYLAVSAAAVALLSLRRPTRRRYVLFYVLVAIGYLVLSLGPGTPLFDLYARLPFGAAFRFSDRLRWVTSFALAMLVGLAADAIGGGRLLRSALVVIVLVNGLWITRAPLFGLRRGDVFGTHAGAFAFVRERLTAQDRVAIVGRFTDFGLAAKTATLFRIPAIYDYQAQGSARYADFFTFMRLGRPMRDVDDWYWVYGHMLPPTLRRPLFDLTAARYLIVDTALDTVPTALPSGVRLLAEVAGTRVYENAQALPRARFVSAVAVVPDGDILPTLASPTHDARRLALIEHAPPGDMAGTTDARATVTIVTDEPERVTARVEATAAGFLVLADQYAPGWTVTVNGEAQELQRADYVFRLVAVPGGTSEVVFRYRPWTVRAGVIVSAGTALAVAIVLRRQATRRSNRT